MTSSEILKDKILNLIKSTDNCEALNCSKGSTFRRLCAIVSVDGFNTHDNKELNFFSKRYDIKKRLYMAYDSDGSKSSDEFLNETGHQIFASQLYLRVLLSFEQLASEIERIKYINVCWKAFENILLPSFLKNASENLHQLQDELLKQLPVNNFETKIETFHAKSSITGMNSKTFRTLPLDVLFYEGPIARAYLETLYSIGCKPRRIIQLISEKDLVTKKQVGRLLPSFIRKKYAATVQAHKIHYWPNYLFRNHKKLCFEVFERIDDAFKIEESTLLGIIKRRPLNQFSDEIHSISIDSFHDHKLFKFITEQEPSTYLFTGGGILPRRLIEMKNTQFLHIHPGYLPFIRGADCLLWSGVLFDNPSATCFFMDAGIDTGRIINAVFLPQIKLPFSASSLGETMNYRMLYSFVDPWVRAVIMKNTLEKTNYLSNIKTTSQKIESGTTFHFMHSEIKKRVINKCFLEH